MARLRLGVVMASATKKVVKSHTYSFHFGAAFTPTSISGSKGGICMLNGFAIFSSSPMLYSCVCTFLDSHYSLRHAT